MEENNLNLVYINPIGKNSEGKNEYEFFFSETPETVWAEDWNIEAPSACSNLQPEPSMYSLVERIETEVPLKCVQQNSCFSMQDCVDTIIAIVWEDISEYEQFPEPYRIVIHYGERYEKVKEILEGREIFFIKNTEELK